jgi:hypothetical protein
MNSQRSSAWAKPRLTSVGVPRWCIGSPPGPDSSMPADRAAAGSELEANRAQDGTHTDRRCPDFAVTHNTSLTPGQEVLSRPNEQAERDRMRARLDEFSRRLDARTREFEQRGEFSDLHRSLLDQIEAPANDCRRSLLRPRAAARRGRSSKPSSNGTSARFKTICCRSMNGLMSIK